MATTAIQPVAVAHHALGFQPTTRSRRNSTPTTRANTGSRTSIEIPMRSLDGNNMKQKRIQTRQKRQQQQLSAPPIITVETTTTTQINDHCEDSELPFMHDNCCADETTMLLPSSSQCSSVSISSDETISYDDGDDDDEDSSSSSNTDTNPIMTPLPWQPYLQSALHSEETLHHHHCPSPQEIELNSTTTQSSAPSWVVYRPSHLMINDIDGGVSLELEQRATTSVEEVQTSHNDAAAVATTTGVVSEVCPTCGTPLSFTPLGDALVCGQPGCSPHRYRIAESTVENLPFGEDVAYFKTMPNKMTNHAQKIILNILGIGSKSRNIASPTYLSDGVLSYMRLCIRAARAHYALFWFGDPMSNGELTSSSQNAAAAAEASAQRIWQEHVTTDMLNGMTALMASSTQTAKRYLKSTLVHYLHLSQPPEFGIESPTGLSKVCKRVAEHYHLLRQYGIAFQPMVLSPDAPITIHEVYAFGKAHRYRVIYEDRLTEVYCKLTGQPMPTLTPAMQRNMRLLYAQFHNFYRTRFADKDTCDALLARDLAAVDAEYSDPRYSCDTPPTYTAVSEALLKHVVTPAWDYKYVWDKIFGLFGATHLRQYVCVNVKLTKFIKLEQTFRVLCKHLGYHFTPTPFAWQPEVAPIDTATLTAIQQQYEEEMAASTRASSDDGTSTIAYMADAQYDRHAAHATRHYVAAMSATTPTTPIEAM